MQKKNIRQLPRRILNKVVISTTQKIAERNLRSNEGLWKTLTGYLHKTGSTGCSYTDYWTLYNYVRQNKPSQILECGTGVTTIVMAYALMENERKGLPKGRLISMENDEKWFDLAIKLLPKEMNGVAEIMLSEKAEYCYSIFRGVGYRDIPELDYDFVFVDGPGTIAPSDGTRSFDFDFINVVKNSTTPVFGIVDKRMGTCYVLQKIFGVNKARYDAKLNLGFVGPCTKQDIRSKISGDSFSHSISLFGRNELNLHMGL